MTRRTAAPAFLRRVRNLRTAAVGLAVAGTMLAACSPASNGDTAGDTGKATDTVVVGTTTSIRTGNPLDVQYQIFQYNAFDPLVRIIAGQDSEPRLATQWEQVDDRTWDFTLRDGVTFHDGSKLTADDVVFSFEEPLKESLLTASVLTTVDKVRAVDGKTVRITTEEPDALLLNSVAQVPIVPKKAYQAGGADAFAKKPIGTGPYEIVKYEANSGVDFRAYDGFWGDAAKTENVELRYFSDATSLSSALESGQVDVAHELAPNAIKTLGANSEFTVSSNFSGNQNMLTFNSTEGPFKDIRVREAATAAVNADELIDALTYGAGVPEDGQLPVNGVFGHTDDITRTKYDPARAEELLAEAGQKNPKITIAGMNLFKPVLEAVGDQLAKVGFDVTIQADEIAAWSQQLREGTDADLFYKGVGYVGVYDADRPFSQVARGTNPMVEDPEWDRLYEATRTELDEGERAKKIAAASQYLAERSYVLWTYGRPSVGAVSASVQGVDFSTGLMILLDDITKSA